MRQGVARTTCVAELGKELAALQIKLTEGFFEEVVPSFRLAGDPFDRNKVYFFDTAGDCVVEVNKQSATLNASKLATDNAELLKCKPICANDTTAIKTAAKCIHVTMRSALRGQQATFVGKVDTALGLLSRAQLAVYDKVLAAQQQQTFISLLQDGRRQRQLIGGIILNEIATAVAVAKTGRFQNYRHIVSSQVTSEVAEVLKVFAVELEKDKRIADAKLRLVPGLVGYQLVEQALSLAAKRKSTVLQPVAVLVRVANLGAAQEAAVVDSFKTVLGPEAVFSQAADDAINAGEKQFDVAVGVDLPEVATLDTELGLACIQHAVSCEFIENVHSGLFNLVRSATKSPTPQPTEPLCPVDDSAALTACGTKVGECVKSAGGTVDNVCPCYGGYISCISSNPALAECTGFNATKKSFLDACRTLKCASCGPTMPPAPTPPLSPCELAQMQQRTMCTDAYPGTVGGDAYRLVMAAQLGVISAVTTRICASLREYLVCSRRILEAGTCNTTALDIEYLGRSSLCRDSKLPTLLKDIDCNVCTALTDPLVPGTPIPAPGGSTTAVASADTNTGHRLAAALGLALIGLFI